MSAVPTSGVIGESHARTYAAGVAGIADGLAVMPGSTSSQTPRASWCRLQQPATR
jgi:hypothetical protein